MLKLTRTRGARQPTLSILAEDLAIHRAHQARRAHAALDAALHQVVRLAVVDPRAVGEPAARNVDPRVGDDLFRFARRDPGGVQGLGRQVESPDRGVFVDVTQHVGELQGQTEMVGQLSSMRLGHAEYPDRQPPDGAGDSVAVEREGLEIRGADRRSDVHRHAVDHRDEVGFRKMEVGYRSR